MSALAPLHTENPRKGMLKIHQPHHHEINIASKFENSRMTNIQQMSTTTQSKWHMTSARYKKFIKIYQRKFQEMRKTSRIKCKCFELLFFSDHLP